MNFSKNSLALIIILGLFLSLRLPGLGYDISNSDAARWHRRSEKFLTSLKQFELQNTYQHYQPGVTLMWMNSVVKQGGFWYQESFSDQIKTLENSDFYPLIHKASKTQIVFVLMVLLMIIVKSIQKLFSTEAGLLTGFLISIEPYVVGLDRFFHLTSLETYSAVASILMLLVWLQSSINSEVSESTKTKAYLLGSSLLFTFSFLTKITTLALLPTILYIFYLAYQNSKNVRPLLVFSTTTLATTLLLFPALIVSPVTVTSKIFNAIFDAVNISVRSNTYTGVYSFAYYPLILLFKLTPTFLALSILSTSKCFSKCFKDRLSNSTSYKILLFFLLNYFGILTLSSQKIDRYSLNIIIPLIVLISASLNLKAVLSQKKLISILLAFHFLLALFILKTHFPAPTSYYSALFGGTSRALELDLYDNNGEFYAQAAFYLNSYDRNTTIFVPHNSEAFSYFYKGNIIRDNTKNYDFVVTSIDHINEIPTGCLNTIQHFGPKNQKIVSIYKCQKPIIFNNN